MGLPDLYDGSNGSGLGSHGLMANSWGFPGTQYNPPIMSPWSREILGWGDAPTIISSDGQYSVHEAGAPCDSCVQIYKITHNMPSGEFLLIENRQKSGFESTNPGDGLVIYHIDNSASYTSEGFPGQDGWPSNGNHYVSFCFLCDLGDTLFKCRTTSQYSVYYSFFCSVSRFSKQTVIMTLKRMSIVVTLMTIGLKAKNSCPRLMSVLGHSRTLTATKVAMSFKRVSGSLILAPQDL